MNSWHSFGLTVLAQVTAITVVASFAIALSPRWAALRHTIGVLALTFVLASPILIVLLPRASWLGSIETPAPDSDSRPINSAPIVRRESEQAHINADVTIEQDKAVVSPADLVATQSGWTTFARITDVRGESKPLSRWTVFIDADRTTWLGRCFNLIAWVWAAGILVLCRRFLVTRGQIRHLAASVQPGSIAATIAEKARLAIGLAKLPPTAISDLAPMPLVLGCWRPLLVLPRRLVETGSAAQLRDVLIHECAHILRRDPWVHAAQRVASIVFWPHPGVHWLNREIARAREEVCDNFVLKQGHSAEYAQMLLELAEHCGGTRLALSSLGMFSRRWTLEDRISGILNPRRETMTRTSCTTPLIVTMLLGALTVLVGGIGAFGQVSKETTVPPAEKNQSQQSQGAMKRIAVRGACQNQDAKSISDVRIRVFRITSYTDTPKLVAEVRSDDAGTFLIPDVETVADHGQREGWTDLMVAATAKGYASAVSRVNEAANNGELSLVMSNNPGTLSGVVVDAQGQPLKGVTVFLPCLTEQPLPGCMCAVTDEQGRYAICDLRRWKPEDTKTFDPKTGLGSMTTSCFFRLQHPDYARTLASYFGIPQEIKVTLYSPAIVEGLVFDEVSGQPLANVVVSAQGVARDGWQQSRTDPDGRYRLKMNKDHYNIWAEADDRIAIAVKALAVEQGKTVKAADIHMVRGGFVVGTVIDASTGKPIRSAANDPLRVAHYGPARPRTGAAVTSTPVHDDGTFRLRVAPGRNYVYLMNGTASAIVHVQDGQELKLDLHAGEHVPRSIHDADPDLMLAEKLHREAREEDAEQARLVSGAPPSPPKRKRPDTPTGGLLDKLEQQNAGSALFGDSWCRTLKQIVDLGPDAVPELIDELDATDDGKMIRCLGFTLRAIGDKRAVPALIRAIPKTLLPPGSDMGLRAEDAQLVTFAQKHDLHETNHGNEYGFGRPVREVFGALQKLTGKKLAEEELFHTFLDGVATQQRMKHALYYRMATKWADWWEQNASDFTQDPAYSRVNLEEMAIEAIEPPHAGAHYKTGSGGSNKILESVYDPKSRRIFYDCDTGRTAGLPKKWRDVKNIESQLDEIIAWAAREGFDLMGTEYVAPGGQRHYALREIGLRAWELGPERWKMESRDITIEALQDEGTPVNGLLLHFDEQTELIDPNTVASFFYITREGTPGLLFVGIEVKDDSLKPGGVSQGDDELSPIAFHKGRRFAFKHFEEVE